ncbi:nidogen-like domain-containing protein [Bradyrhizobium genosp. P]|uniref:nidogen-like domain-containing protein n=1 Tax=Bradyrhizobium genosp. P TaxID=83641 RepID=UPI003CEA88AB
MNYAGKFGSSGLDSLSHTHIDLDSLAHPGSAEGVTIPDAHLLFSGDYHKSGGDLVISDETHRVVVPNYFHGDKHPALRSPDGAPMDPRVVDALTGHTEYAQAGGATPAKLIGHVAKLSGSASIVRNGVTVDLQNGDAVYQTDVVQTGSNSTLGLVLNDGTTFNLSANARLMLNDLTYDPTSTNNTSLFTLVQGAATFVAGQVAKTGDMKVGTPIATMGIRGTAVTLDIDSNDGNVSISVIDQHDSLLHSVQVFDSQGNLIGMVTSSGGSLTLTPTATFNVIAQMSDKTPAQVAAEFNAFQAALNTYELQKAIDPNLPQHTDNANPQTRYASVGSSSPADSPYTESLKPSYTNGGSPNQNGDPTSQTDPHLFTIGGSLPGTTPSQTFVVVKPVGTEAPPPSIPFPSIPFPVTPSPVGAITTGAIDHTGPVMSASGNVVYDPDGVIYYYDRATGTTTQVTPANDGFTYSGQTISSDGRYVVYQGTDGTHTYIFVWGTDPSDPAHFHKQIEIVAGSSPAVSGDGSTILAQLAGGGIGIFDLQGNSKGTITPAVVGATGTLLKPAISADGHIIAFWSADSAPGGSGHLFTYNVSTGLISEIASTSTGAGITAASISADGHYVVYQSEGASGHTEISMYDLTTGHVVFTTANAPAGDSSNPVISPDGHFIIFTSTAELTPDDTNTYADTYVVDVTDPAHPVFKLVSAGSNAPSEGGVAISAGGLYFAFASNSSFSGGSSGANNIYFVDPTSGHGAIIQETASSPAQLTASGEIQITGGSSGVSLSVTDASGNPTNLLTAAFDSNGNVQWSFSEAKSDFAGLHYGDDLAKVFNIVLSYSGGTTTVPVTVAVQDLVQPVIVPAEVAPVADPVTLADAHGDGSYTITPNTLLKAVSDIDSLSLSITDVSIKTGGGTLVHNQDGSWTYTPASGFHGEVVFNYTASDGTLTATSTASLSVQNDPATITGPAAGSVSEGASVTANGTLTVHDIDAGEAVFRPVASAALTGAYGNFTFDASTGAWTYTLDSARADSLSGGQVVHEQLTVTSFDGTAQRVIDVTVTGFNEAPVITSGTVATGSIMLAAEGGGHNTISPGTAAELATSGLISNLPNATGFGTLAMLPNDDGSSSAIDITSVFGSGGIDFFGHHFTSLYINNNGNITFSAPLSAYTPEAIGAGFDSPIIAPFWAHVDTRGHGQVFYDLDQADGIMTITWDDVGYYSAATDKLNSFQVVLINEGGGNFDIEYRYGQIQWTTGGTNGLGGTPARIGYSAGDGSHYYELPQSGNQIALLTLPQTAGNTGIDGVDVFDVRNGEVDPPTLTTNGTIDFADPNLLDTHTVQSVTYTGSGAALGTLTLALASDTTGSGTGGEFTWTYDASSAAVRTALDGIPSHSKIETFDVVISDGHGGTVSETVSVTLTEAVEQPPVLKVPTSTQTIGIDQSAAISGISLSETGATPDAIFVVTLADTHGVLSATAVGDGDTVSTDGTNLTITGTLSDVNSDLATLHVTNGTLGADTITLSAVDNLGNTASAQIATTVNDVPAITVGTDSHTFVAGHQAAIGGISLAESGNTTGEIFTVTLTDQHGVLSANAVGDGDTVSAAGTTLSITGTLSDVNTDLATLIDTSATPGSDPIYVTAIDSLGNTATQQTVGVSVTQAEATTLTFDDLPAGGIVVPNGYGSLNWSNFDYLHGPSIYPSGYFFGTVSAPNVAYNGYGNPASVSGAAFDFIGADLTSAWNNGLTITVDDYNNGTLLDEKTVVVNTTSPTWFEFDFTDITNLVFTSSGGTSAGYNGSGTQFALDNFTYSEFSSGGNNSSGPVVAGADNSVTYAGTPVSLDPSVAVTDDTGTVASVNVWISSGARSGDALSINGSLDGELVYSDGTIHYHFDNVTHPDQPSIFLSGIAGSPSAADFDAALQLIKFAPGAADGERTVTWAAYDNVVHSPTVTTTVEVGPILNSFALTVGEGGTTVLCNSDFNVSDPGYTNLTYTVGDVAGGQFNVFNGETWVSAPTGGFTTGQIEAGHVEFVQDGTATVPSFLMHVSDPDNASPDIAANVTLEIPGATTQTVTFGGSSGTLQLDDPAGFAGKIAGIVGTGNVLDLRGFDAADDPVVASTGAGSFDSDTDTTSLVVTDQTTSQSVTLKLAGDLSGSSWTVSDDQHDGVNIVDPPASGDKAGVDPEATSQTIVANVPNQTLTGTGASNNFAFDFTGIGHDTVTNFHPTTDTLQFGSGIFANAQAALTAAHDDGHGNTVITLDASDAIVLSGVAKAQLHAADFHFA